MVETLGIINDILALLKTIYGWFKSLSNRVSGKQSLPKQTLTLVPDPMKTGWWGNRPLAIVNVNNISDEDVKIASVFLTRRRKVPFLRRPKVSGQVVVKIGHGRYDSENRLIPAGEMREARLEFRPVLSHRKNETFKADIIVIDQFNNKHLVKGVEFRQKKA